MHTAQGVLPALLELRCNQPIVWITGSLTPLRERGLVSSLLQFQFLDAPLFCSILHVPPLSFQSCFNRHWLNDAQSLAGDRGVDTGPAEGKASGLSEHQVWFIAAIDGLSRRTTRVTDHHAAPATTTGQQPRQQRPSATPRFEAASLAIGVDGKLLLVPFELRPVDISCVVVLEQNLAIFEWFGMSVALACAAIDNLGSLLAFAVGIDACIERSFEHRYDIAITDLRPFEGDQLFAIGWPWEVDTLGGLDSSTCRALPNLRKRSKISPITFWMRRSGTKPRPTSRCQI